MTPRWMTERKHINKHNEILTVIEIYAPGENKELVRQENKNRKHRRELLLVES